MVLALRGSHSMADAVTDLMDRPVDICDWLPEQFRQVLRPCCWAVLRVSCCREVKKGLRLQGQGLVLAVGRPTPCLLWLVIHTGLCALT